MTNLFPVTRAPETPPELMTEPRVASEPTPVSSSGKGRPTWAPWSALQIVVAALGGFLIVLGVLALADSGIGDWTSPEVSVWGFAHTPLMAVIEIALGLSLLAATSNPFAAKASLFGFGALMTVFGVITLLDPGALGDWLGANRQMGLFYTAAGAGGVLLGGVIPIMR